MTTTDSDQRPETWKGCNGLSKYEASDLGQVRNVATGRVLAAKVGTHGYLEVKPYGDDGKRQTRTVHSLVLEAFAGPCPPGQETLHGRGGPHDNRWPENLRWGTKAENHADQRRAGTATRPLAYPCVNHERCAGEVARPGSRCLPCAMEVGRRAAAMLSAGMNLETVTRRLGYQSQEWVYKLATRHGGYQGTIAQARGQGRRLPARVMATLRYRLASSAEREASR